MQTPPGEAHFAGHLQVFQAKNGEVEQEALSARNLIESIMSDTSTPSDNVVLAPLDGRIEAAVK